MKELNEKINNKSEEFSEEIKPRPINEKKFDNLRYIPTRNLSNVMTLN